MAFRVTTNQDQRLGYTLSLTLVDTWGKTPKYEFVYNSS